MTDVKTLIIDAGLFEDAGTLREAAGHLSGAGTARLNQDGMTDQDWDDVLNSILMADRTITL